MLATVEAARAGPQAKSSADSLARQTAWLASRVTLNHGSGRHSDITHRQVRGAKDPRNSATGIPIFNHRLSQGMLREG